MLICLFSFLSGDAPRARAGGSLWGGEKKRNPGVQFGPGPVESRSPSHQWWLVGGLSQLCVCVCVHGRLEDNARFFVIRRRTGKTVCLPAHHGLESSFVS